eukprot:CAMPEP_0117688308 /NCGR_PEP_ID=MMETSP0804-20121206/23741_1 /TAXON_ID=1074897 /ORGANISM="Tetraselmis astigmatica, Strain CCMP880" /LENGTH=117 /DNA_ID=CAMNT_0005500713 /DNA_START=640 /DNA_END=991 /DNA_ORIENTATION=+
MKARTAAASRTPAGDPVSGYASDTVFTALLWLQTGALVFDRQSLKKEAAPVGGAEGAAQAGSKRRTLRMTPRDSLVGWRQSSLLLQLLRLRVSWLTKLYGLTIFQGVARWRQLCRSA